MSLLGVPKEFNKTASSTTDLAEVIKANLTTTSISSLTTKGLSYTSFAFNKGYSNDYVVNKITPTAGVLDSQAYTLISQADGFTISQLNENGDYSKVFRFSLLPAVESSIGGRQTPEIKPGILKRSSVNIKTFTLPGGVPAFQSLGLEPTMMQLVGLFIGSESTTEVDTSFNDKNKFSVNNGVAPLYTPYSSVNAYQAAIYFEQQFVQNNRPVEINISSNNSNTGMPNYDATMVIMYKALIQNVRFFIARQDRIYYSLDVLLLSYPSITSKNLPTPTVTKTNPSYRTEPPAEPWDI